MKKGYMVINKINYKFCNFILVCNYNGLNQIINYSFLDPRDYIDESDIGMWKIKKLKHE